MSWRVIHALCMGIAVGAAMLWPGSGAAQAQAADPSLLSLSVGWFDVIDNEEDALEGRIEYRPGYSLWFFKPFAGITATSDSAVFGYAGILVDIPLGAGLVLTPSFAPGLYSDGGGKDLGHAVEFRSQIELAYRFDDSSRLGLSFNHISNAGLGDHNPGSESVALTYSLPTARLFGR